MQTTTNTMQRGKKGEPLRQMRGFLGLPILRSWLDLEKPRRCWGELGRRKEGGWKGRSEHRETRGEKLGIRPLIIRRKSEPD